MISRFIPGTWARFFGAAFAVTLLDQLSKWYIVSELAPGEDRPLIQGFFSLVHAHNPGAAFGLFAGLDQPLRGLLLGLTTAAALVTVGYFLFREYNSDRLGQLALGLIVGGAAGNIIDRVRLGIVVDFLDIYVGEHHWPAFNVADSAICIGVGLLLLAGRAKQRQA